MEISIAVIKKYIIQNFKTSQDSQILNIKKCFQIAQFPVRLMWTVGLIVEIKLRFQISLMVGERILALDLR